MFIVFWDQKAKKPRPPPPKPITFAHANITGYVQKAWKYFHFCCGLFLVGLCFA